MSLELSSYQKNIIKHISEGNGSLFVEAVAGSSKTFTLVEASKFIQDKKSIFLAFNKHIADNLKRRLPPNFDVRTINSLGFKMWRDYIGNCQVNVDKVDNIIDELALETGDRNYNRFRWSIRNMASMAKINGLVPDIVDGFDSFKANSEIALNEMVYENDNIFNQIDEAALQDKREYEIAFRSYAKDIISKSKKVLKINIEMKNEIDFDDQIYFPIIYNVSSRSFEYVLCDEAQDLSPIQIELIKKVTDKNTIVVGVADPKQSIYGFRGVDKNAINKFKEMFLCVSLPLTICYRCPKTVIKKAQEYNSKIEHWDSAVVGKVNDYGHNYNIKSISDGHMILSRFNAPLLDMAIRMISENRQFHFEGRMLGKELITLVKFFRAGNVLEITKSLDEWYKKKEMFLKAKQREEQLVNIKDKYYSLSAICSKFGCDQSVDKVIDLISVIFNGTSGVKLSTIHKAKGAEADVVWILDFDKLPYKHNKDSQEIDHQEINLVYVATTRAKKEMNFIFSREEFRQEYYKEYKTVNKNGK